MYSGDVLMRHSSLGSQKKLATWCLWNEYLSVVEAVHFALRYKSQEAVEVLECVQRLLDVDEPYEGNNGDRHTPDHTREEEDVLTMGKLLSIGGW